MVILVERIGTFADCIPTALKLMRAESVPEEKVQSVAVQSMHLNRARSALTLIAWIAHGKHSRCRARP